MNQLLQTSEEYLKEHPETIQACNSFIEDGYSVNKAFDKGIITETASLLLKAIDSTTLNGNIRVYRGLSDEIYDTYSKLNLGESITTNRLTSCTLIRSIAESHSENVIEILLENGTHAFFVSAVNEIGEGLFSKRRQVDLLIESVNGYESATLEGEDRFASGEEEVLLAPGTFTSISPNVFFYSE